ncbi:peptidoglycan-binding protein, partial [Clostridium algidicarnis]
NTDKGPNTKSGYVKYEGGSVTKITIPKPSTSGVSTISYGKSGKERDLTAYKIGNGNNSLVMVCEVHGFEDNFPKDGLELVNIGNDLIRSLASNGTKGWSVYVIPAANPDGLAEGYTNNGPGRCTIVGGVDINRDFPIGFTSHGTPRYWTGDAPLSVNESKKLSEFIQGIKNKTSGKMVVIDLHGWEGAAIGNPEIGQYFRNQFGFEQRSGYGADRGFLIAWAKSIGADAALIELPKNTHSHSDVINGGYSQKVINAVNGIISNNPGGGSIGKWIQKGDNWYYYENDLMVTGWKSINGSWYYLESSGAMATGWNSIDGSWYYLESSGAMVTGWNSIDGSWYYLESNGAMATGWKSIDGSWYYLESSGAMATGLKSINDSWYYLESNGAMATGEIIMSGKTYHFDNSGKLYLILNKKITVDDITQIQERLQKLKLFDGFISGYYDDLTKSAVRQFQLKYNIMPTYGVANEETIYAIKKSNPSISYILYDEEAKNSKPGKLFKDTAEVRKKKYCEKYPYTEVELVPVSGAHDFKNKWNNIGLDSKGNEIKVAVVELQFHGTVGDAPDGKGIGHMFNIDNDDNKKDRIVVSDKLDEYNRDTDIIISTLKSKKMDLLYFSSCNTGNPDVENVGNAFKKVVTANEIIAWDGGTIFNWDTGEDEPGPYRKTIDKIKRDQATWYKYVDKDKDGTPLRDRKGRVWI